MKKSAKNKKALLPTTEKKMEEKLCRVYKMITTQTTCAFQNFKIYMCI